MQLVYIQKSGKYGGTYAHKDIIVEALNLLQQLVRFFKLYLIKNLKY